MADYITKMQLNLKTGDGSSVERLALSNALDLITVEDQDQTASYTVAGSFASYVFKHFSAIKYVVVQNTHATNDLSVVWYDATSTDYCLSTIEAGEIHIIPNVRASENLDLQVGSLSAFTAEIFVVGEGQ